MNKGVWRFYGGLGTPAEQLLNQIDVGYDARGQRVSRSMQSTSPGKDPANSRFYLTDALNRVIALLSYDDATAGK